MWLFDEDIKLDGEVSTAKAIKVLVSLTRKMETVLVEIRKLISRATAEESSRPPRPPPTDTPHKEKPLSKVKTPLLQRPEKEVIVETSGATPPTEVVAAKSAEVAAAPVVTPGSKEKKSVITEPSPRKGKKKKDSSPEKEEELEETSGEAGSSTEETGSDQVAPALETKRVNMRSSDRKRPPPELKTPSASKKHQKSPGKGGSSQKKLRTK